MATDAARWWAKASGARTRTHVPRIPTERDAVDSHASSEVTAQRMTAAFNAVHEITALILERRDDLMAIESGRLLVERAERTRQAFSGD